MTLPTKKWRPLIAEACAYAPPVPEDVLEAMVLVESNGNPKVRSVSDARGLTQIIPKWHADVLGKKVAADLNVTLTDETWYDPKFSLFAGARLLKGHYGECGSWTGAVRKYHSGSCSPPPGFVDGGGTSSDQHITKYLAALQQVRDDRADAPTPKETPMAYRAHQAVGLSKPLYLPDDIVFETKIIPSSHRNVRSNTKRPASVVKFVTRHETANFNRGANADMHYRYLMGNPSPAAGYNCVHDDRKIIHLTPYDEDTWAAGTAVGNRTSDHHELCVNADIDHTKARRISAALDAAVLYARGLPLSSLVQHNYWTGKDCPYLLRREGRWAAYTAKVAEFYNGIKAQVEGGTKPTPTPAPKPQYEKASPIAQVSDSRPFVALDNKSILVRADVVVKATKATPRLKWADPKSPHIGPMINAGEQFAVDYLIVNPDQSLYWYTPWGTRVIFKDTEIVDVDEMVATLTGVLTDIVKK